jgi:hypothetical protein
MGRGRAKAKQTKVARELKYSAPNMDLDRLQRDLHSDDPFLGRPGEADPSEGVGETSYLDEEDDEANSAAS